VIAEQRSALLGGQHWQPWYRHVLFITGWRASLLQAAACGSALLLAAALPARTCCVQQTGRPPWSVCLTGRKGEVGRCWWYCTGSPQPGTAGGRSACVPGRCGCTLGRQAECDDGGEFWSMLVHACGGGGGEQGVDMQQQSPVVCQGCNLKSATQV
jgi:hypothetical protein